jgi:hypothetical protein
MSIADLPAVALPEARPSEHPITTQYSLDEATRSLVLLSAASGAVLALFAAIDGDLGSGHESLRRGD